MAYTQPQRIMASILTIDEQRKEITTRYQNELAALDKQLRDVQASCSHRWREHESASDNLSADPMPRCQTCGQWFPEARFT